MSQRQGPVYEVTLQVDAAAAGDLDSWLDEHIAELLQLPGFVDAEVSEVENSEDRETRVVRYFMASVDDLDNYLAGPASAMRAKTAAQFGEHLTASRRVLHSRANPDPDEILHCPNCNAPLTGQYCGQCGQRAQSRLISVWELLRDAFGDVFDVDSRLWRTIVQLAIRPGNLTRDYLRGRRARYMPPFRTYLVLSLLFFVIAFLDPKQEFSLFFEPADEPVAEATAGILSNPEVLNELKAEGIEVSPADQENSSAPIQLSIGGKKVENFCDLADYDTSELPPWLASRLPRERVEHMCLRMFSADGEGFRGFLDKLLENVPAGLFFLLPLMALVLKVLYPLSKRYYVEHLLFVVHYHAFVFLALIVQILLARGGNLILAQSGSPISAPDVVLGLLLFAVPCYIPVYLYKALRRVYEQGHWRTSFKFSLLFIAYWIGLSIILLVMSAIAVFSI